MLHLIQVIKYMLVNLEYSPQEIELHFDSIIAGQASVKDLIDSLGLEMSINQILRMEQKVTVYKSALFVASSLV